MASNMGTSTRFYGNHNAKILNDLNETRKSRDSYCDVILSTAGKNFYAHKCVLEIVSVFFERKFKAERKRKYFLPDNIFGRNAETIELVLNYIYTGLIQIDQKNVVHLLSVSNFLEIQELKQFSMQFMNSNMNVNNCVGFMINGDACSCDMLSENARIFVAQRFDEVIHQQEFKRLSKREAILFLKQRDQAVFGSKGVYEGVVSWVKYDYRRRSYSFADLLKVVHLHMLPGVYLKEVVARQRLMKSQYCQRMLQTALLRQLTLPLSISKASAEVSSTNQQMQNTKEGFVLVGEEKVVLFDIATKKFKNLPDLPGSGKEGCIVGDEDGLYLLGGQLDYNGIHYLNFLSLKDGWTEKGQTLSVRIRARALFHNGMIVINGGACSSVLMETFDPVSLNCIANPPSTENARTEHCFVEYNDGLVCIAGCDAQNKNVTKYDPKNGTWSKLPDLLQESHHGTAVAVEDQLFVIGKKENNSLHVLPHEVQIFHHLYNIWRAGNDTQVSYTVCDATVIKGELYLFGRDGNTYFLQIYDAKKDKWNIVHQTNYDFECDIISAI